MDYDKEEDFSSDELDQYSSYDKVEVSLVNADLQIKAKNLIDGISRIYTSTGLSIDEEYISSIKAVESDALVSMLKQVKYAEHMLDSLMKRFDNGGYVNNEIYDQIKSMQHHVIQMNLEVTKYTRLLPEFFKFTESDAKTIQTANQIDYSGGSQQTKQIENAVVVEHTPINTPQFGTKAFLESINAISSMDNIEDILENEPEELLDFDPSDAIENEEKFDDEE